MAPTNPQPELALDHSPALETAMRTLFETRWARWHPQPFDEAVKDPITRQLLCLTVQHMPHTYGLQRRRGVLVPAKAGA